MSRPGRDFDSDYDVEDDEEPSSAESDDSYDPEMPSTPKARRRPAAPPPRPRKKRRRRRAVAASSSSSDSDGGGPRTLYCALCRRDVHEDSFSAAVKRGDYGKHMTEPFCLAHSAGDQRRYALRPAREDTSDSDSDGDGDGVSRGLAGGRLAANLLARHGLESDEDVVMADGDDDALDRAETILETGRGRLRGANRRLRFDDDDDDEEEEAAAPAAPEPDDDDDDGDGGDECAICFEAIAARDGFTTACAHQFHASCVAAMRAAAAGGASRCPMCRAAFPAVVSDALDRGAAGAAAAAETRGLRAGDGVQVRWEVEGPGGAATLEWYDATLVRHLGSHGHVGLAVAEVPERFLSARGFVLAYKDEPGERHVMLASDGLLFDAAEGLSMHWRAAPRPRRRRRIVADDDDDDGAF